MKDSEKLTEIITREEILELLQDLTKIDSPYFEESQAMQYVKKWFTDQQIDAQIYEYHESKVTDFHGKDVVMELKGQQPGPVICLNGHLDTVQLCKGWEKDPCGQLEGDRFYGRGALDMKSGCAANMVALKAFSQMHKNFRGAVKASFVSVEEGPYGMGTNALIENGYMEGVDFSIITEPSAAFTESSYPSICLGARGGYGLEVIFTGKSAHAAIPELGISAAEDAAAFVNELKNVDYVQDPHLGKGVACVVGISADGGACSVPDHAVVKIFWHIVVGEDENTIRKEIQKAATRAGLRGTYEICFREAPSEGSKGFLPYTVAEDDCYVQKFQDSVRAVCGKEAGISYFQSIGDFNYLGSRLGGAPAVIFGADGKNFHSADEYVEIDTVVETARIVYDFLVQTLVENS